MLHQNYFVYILTNADRRMIQAIGVTNSPEGQASEHSLGLGSAFARQDNAHKLIYFEALFRPDRRNSERETTQTLESREKEALIARKNPQWHDSLSEMCASRPVKTSR